MIKLNEHGQKAAEAFTLAREHGRNHAEALLAAAHAVIGPLSFVISAEQGEAWITDAHRSAVETYNTTIVRSDEEKAALLWNTFAESLSNHAREV